jgi:hypothetical protein
MMITIFNYQLQSSVIIIYNTVFPSLIPPGHGASTIAIPQPCAIVQEKEKNAVTIKEAKEAQEAVAQALQVLKES